jgi:AcrR family transcriptional regulator
MVNESKKQQNVELALSKATELVLTYGIEGTTKEMIARSSGLSRKSIDRYFTEKPIYMLQIAKKLNDGVFKSINGRYNDGMFTDGKYSGADLLEMYMQDVKSLFMHKPNIFVFYMEFKIYLSHNDEYLSKETKELSENVGCRRLLESIFVLGQIDGSLCTINNPAAESKYFCREFLSFLSDMAITYESHKEATIQQVDRYIEKTLKIYKRD